MHVIVIRPIDAHTIMASLALRTLLIFSCACGTNGAFAVAPPSRLAPSTGLCPGQISAATARARSLALAAAVEGEDDADPGAGAIAPKASDDANPCGEGFYPAKGEHGDVCVFDYDAAATGFGTATEERDVTCDADDYWRELEAKNELRRKYGLKPLTPEQFVVLRAQISEMEVEARKEQDAARRTIREDREEAAASRDKGSGAFRNFVSGIFRDTCESNFDCQRPEVCCDFGFKKTCCNGGETAKSLYGEYATVPVPQSR